MIDECVQILELNAWPHHTMDLYQIEQVVTFEVIVAEIDVEPDNFSITSVNLILINDQLHPRLKSPSHPDERFLNCVIRPGVQTTISG